MTVFHTCFLWERNKKTLKTGYWNEHKNIANMYKTFLQNPFQWFKKYEVYQRKCVLHLKAHCIKHSFLVIWPWLNGRYFTTLACFYITDPLQYNPCIYSNDWFVSWENKMLPFGGNTCLHFNNHFTISEMWQWGDWVDKCNFSGNMGEGPPLDEEWRLSWRGGAEGFELSIKNS